MKIQQKVHHMGAVQGLQQQDKVEASNTEITLLEEETRKMK